jgi:hypothetical protein
MKPRNPKDEDPTVEEEALEFDGTKTDQLDESYRRQIASDSEKETGDAEDREQPLDAAAIDKAAGYDPYETGVETGSPKGFAGAKRKVTPRSK